MGTPKEGIRAITRCVAIIETLEALWDVLPPDMISTEFSDHVTRKLNLSFVALRSRCKALLPENLTIEEIEIIKYAVVKYCPDMRTELARKLKVEATQSLPVPPPAKKLDPRDATYTIIKGSTKEKVKVLRKSLMFKQRKHVATMTRDPGHSNRWALQTLSGEFITLGRSPQWILNNMSCETLKRLDEL